jgi:hypothetical protein
MPHTANKPLALQPASASKAKHASIRACQQAACTNPTGSFPAACGTHLTADVCFARRDRLLRVWLLLLLLLLSYHAQPAPTLAARIYKAKHKILQNPEV